jgi:eukaryotic-like serine/threonine-protein kinase
MHVQLIIAMVQRWSPSGQVCEPGHDVSTDDLERAGFAATVAGLQLTAADSLAFDATVIPSEVSSFTSFHGSGRLPTIPVRFAGSEQGRDEPPVDAELELGELLGEGGMGKVYRATQRSLGREVAVKTLHSTASVRAAAALCDEAVVTGRLSHPNVIPVHALGNAGDGRPLLVMKRIEGVGWNVLLRSRDHAFWASNEIAPEDQLHFHIEVLRKVTHAVAFAHSHDVVHRDIKPDNVMIGDFGEVYLVDWGIAAKIGTDTAGKLAGTPSYLAPEMLGGIVDVRTDVYLLGATLFEILTGAPPHRGTTLKDVLYSAFLSTPPTFGDTVPDELAELCRHSLARDPAARPTSAQAFGDAIDDHVRHRGSRAIARTGEERLAQLRRAVEDVSPVKRDLAEVRRLIAESRFAFLEARRGWSDNPVVSPGLAATLRLAVRAELDRRDAEAARAMLDELDPPEPALANQVEALESELAREARERERLARLAHDLDPNVARGTRVAAATVIIGMVVAISIYVLAIDTVTKEHVFGISLVMFVGLIGVLVVVWRKITRNMFNRRLAAWVAVGISLMVSHRAVALFDASATTASILTTDLLLVGGMWVFGSLFLFRWMLPVGLGVALAAIPAVAFPSSVMILFSIVNGLAIASFIVGWRMKRPRVD